MSNVHIVIPVYGNYHLTHELLWNLNRKEKKNISSILVVDDASEDNNETADGILWWRENKLLPINTLKMESNVGFLQTANAGMRMYSENPLDEIVLLISNDVLINSKFISQICDIINENSSSLVGGILYTQDTGWNRFDDRIFPYLEGWLLATTVQNWGRLEYFDERYSPSDFEDVDLSTKAIRIGMELVPLNNVGLVHLSGKTIGYNPEREKITKINQEKFRLKWIG